MKVNTLVIAAGTLAIAGAATADFTGATFVSTGVDTWRVYMNFDNPADRLLAISGNAAVSGLFYQSLDAAGNASAEALVENSALNGLFQGDIPLADLGGDSWVTIGADSAVGLNVGFSPGFAGGDGVTSNIVGSSWGHADNGGYFNGDPGNGNGDGGTVLVAQFGISNFEFGGTVDYTPAGGSATSEAFYVNTVPAPGAIAMLGLAGLAARRRRRG